jgi:hypothetical protein
MNVAMPEGKNVRLRLFKEDDLEAVFAISEYVSIVSYVRLQPIAVEPAYPAFSKAH